MTTFQRPTSVSAFDKAAAQALAALCFSLLLAICISNSPFDSQARFLGCLRQSVSLRSAHIPHFFGSNRVGVTTPAETTTLVVDPEGALPKVLSRTKNGVTTRYVYGAGLQYEVSGAGVATYYHYDQSGNTAALSNQAGAITERIAYSPYGTVRYRQSNFDTPFLYGGFFGVMTDANGLINMRSRYYNPATMRFINSDPARDGLNWYAYASGNPLNFADPSGFGAIKTLDAIQTGLAVLGFVPGVGALADIVNAGISVARGNYGEAALSLAAAVPGFGDAFAAGKITTMAVGAAVAARSVRAVARVEVTAARVETAVVRAASTEVVQRAMSRAELEYLQANGTIRFGKSATDLDPHFVSDAVNSNMNRARQRLALPQAKDVRVTMEVQSGIFSPPKTVQPLDLGGGRILSGGGTERTAIGVVRAKVLGVDPLLQC